MSIKHKKTQQKVSLSKKLSAYSAIACASLLTSSPVNAGVYYTDVNPDGVLNGAGDYDIDLNNSGGRNFTININSQSIKIKNQVATRFFGKDVKADMIPGTGTMPIPVTFFKNAAYALDSNQTLSSSGLWPNNNEVILQDTYNSNQIGKFTDGTSKFLGVKFNINGNDANYGWVRLTVASDGSSLTVHDYAYNSEVNAAIETSIPSKNTAPVLSDLDANIQTDGNPIVIDSDVTVSDAELDNADCYDGAKISLGRHDNGVYDPNDIFSNTGNLGSLVEGNSFTLNGETIGTVDSNSGGLLELSFNANATSDKVDEVLQSITYSNSNEANGAQVTLDFIFDDGNLNAGNTNIGDQGYGDSTVSVLTTLQFVKANTTKTNTHSIPTMNEYGLMILAMIIMVSSTRRMRNQEEKI
jgi:hypothetical protein